MIKQIGNSEKFQKIEQLLIAGLVGEALDAWRTMMQVCGRCEGECLNLGRLQTLEICSYCLEGRLLTASLYNSHNEEEAEKYTGLAKVIREWR